MKETIHAQGKDITIISDGNNMDFISLSDIAKYKNPEFPSYLIQNWMRNRSTVEFIGLWEKLHNPDFNYLEFEAIESESGKNSFVLTPKKWIEKTNAIGIRSTQGRYAATYAHKDIALEFAAWISPEFKLYIIKDYERLKEDENSKISLAWNVNRLISKINYRIHTDAIKANLIPENISNLKKSFIYADEADVLNVAMFGQTAKMWRESHLDSKGNIRDEATIQQLIVLSNLESMNAELIKLQVPQEERLVRLNQMAISQMTSLIDNPNVLKLENKGEK